MQFDFGFWINHASFTGIKNPSYLCFRVCVCSWKFKNVLLWNGNATESINYWIQNLFPSQCNYTSEIFWFLHYSCINYRAFNAALAYDSNSIIYWIFVMISTNFKSNKFKNGSNLTNIFKRTQKLVSHQNLFGYQCEFTVNENW